MKPKLHIFSMKLIRNRLILILMILIILITAGMGIFIYQQTCSLLGEKNIESHKDILTSASIILDKQTDECRTIIRKLLRTEDLRLILIEENKKLNDSSTAFNGMSFITLDKLFDTYARGNYPVKEAYVYDLQGDYYYFSKSGKNLQRNVANYRIFSKLSWYEEMIENDGYETFYGYNVITGDTSTFSEIKYIKDPSSLEPVGMIVLEFDKRILEEIFPKYDKIGHYLLLEQRRGSWYIATSDVQDTFEKESLELWKKKDEKYYFTSVEQTNGGWTLAYMIPKNQVATEADHIQRIVVTIAIISVFIAMIVLSFVCYRITKPLYQLRDEIVAVGEEKRNLEESFGDDEIGMIGQEFQKTINEKILLKERILQEEIATQKAELELLQSNINPHFLYNTLDSIYWLAISKDDEEIAEIIQVLSQVFRLALSKGEREITIDKELEFVRNYLYVQNLRFDGKIKVNIQVDDSVRNWKIMKLLIQPFVENAVYHGIEPKMDSGTVTIQVYKENEGLMLIISDDGVGMNSVEDINKGYAIRNVIERIQLSYGERASVNFESQKGVGTTVRIYLPLGENDDKNSID